MRWLKYFLLIACAAATTASSAAAEARIIKVLPHYLDGKGRHTVHTSLYARDAYQVQLRRNAAARSGIRFDVQWKAGRSADSLMLRVDMRGLTEKEITTQTLEVPVQKKGWFSTWSSAALAGDDYKRFGELGAWRVTLWDGDTLLAEQKSFMW